MNMASQCKCIFQSKLKNVISTVTGLKQVIKFEDGAPRGTICTTSAFQAPGSHGYEVNMKIKKVKTAVGFLKDGKTTEYMRDTALSEPHVSMGGAGWIHPKEINASKKYVEGQKVKVEVNFDLHKVTFYVDGHAAGEDEWPYDTAFPAISADGGFCELEYNET